MSGRLEKALAGHRFEKAVGQCRCDWETSHRGNRTAEHRAHLSATVLALLDSPEAREVVAEGVSHHWWDEWDEERIDGKLTPVHYCACEALVQFGDESAHLTDAALAALHEWLGAES